MATSTTICCCSANLSSSHPPFARRRRILAVGYPFIFSTPPADISGVALSSPSPSSSKITLFSSVNFSAPSLQCVPEKEFSLAKRLASIIAGSGEGELFNGDGGDSAGGGEGSGGGGDGKDEGSGDEEKNRIEALLVLSQSGRSLASIPNDLAAAIQKGRIPGSVVTKFFELEKSPVLGWLLQFSGFKERLLADDLFLTKVAIECGVGIFTKVCFPFE